MGQRARPDDGEDECQGDEWVIGYWHYSHSVTLLCVGKYEGKPRPDLAKSWPAEWYTWRSYHAARKFQRSRPELQGYMVCNLTRLLRLSEAIRARHFQAIYDRAKDRAP